MYVDLLGMIKALQNHCYNGLGQCYIQVLLTSPDDKYMLIVFLDPGLNKMYSLSTVYLTTCSRCHIHPVFIPRSFMEGRKVKLHLNRMVLYYSKGFLNLYSNKWLNFME